MSSHFFDNFLKTAQISTTPYPAEGDPANVFPIRRLDGTDTLLHCIDLATYAVFCRLSDHSSFFQRLSDDVAARNLRLIHLWEDVCRHKPAVVASRLGAMAGQSERIPARLTRVRRIDRPTTAIFLEKNHLQVVTQSKYKYGLFLPKRYFRVLSDAYRQGIPEEEELLVAVATFAHPRTVLRSGQPSRSVELVRFASRLGCTVVGGLDKLLKGFIAEHQPDDVMTYADRDWSDGRSYEKLGFARMGVTEPQLFYLEPAGYSRHYPHRIPEELDKTELIPVYNAGSIKFVLNTHANG